MTTRDFNSPETYDAYRLRRRRVVTQKQDWTISTIFDKIVKDKHIILDPEYQRRFVWDEGKSSLLIESILLGIPLPTIYLSEGESADETIDGQQRLTTIVHFITGKYPNDQPFKLRQLRELTMLNGAGYADLPEAIRKDFGRFSLSMICISSESHDDVKFDIFERLNKGSAKLKEHEIRNCVYRGTLNKITKEVASGERFRKIFHFPDKQVARMEDSGFLVACLCLLANNGVMKGSTKDAINKYMEKNRNMPEEDVKKITSQFMTCADTVFTLFGEYSFRKCHSGKSASFGWEPKLNTALALSMIYAVSQFPRHQITIHAEAIRERIIDLMILDADFISSMASQTTSEKNILMRIVKIRDVIQSCISDQGPRLFSYADKVKLFTVDPTCKLCDQRITHIDDSQVDHIVRWVDGGTTDISNGQLAHRICNAMKG